MAKKKAGVLGLDLLLDKKSLKGLIVEPENKPSMVVLVGDDQFVNRHILSRLRKCIHSEEDDESWAWREFSGEDQPDPRDILDEVATVPMFSTAARIATVRRADSFVSSHREILENFAGRSPGNGGFLVLEVRSFPSNTRLAKAVQQHGLIITTSTPPRFDLTGWLQKWAAQIYSIQLPAVTASTILERLGNELGQIDQALSTFAAALPLDGKRSLPPEMVDSLEGMGHQRTVWEMVDAAAAGRTTEAISLLNGLLDAGESPIGLTAQAATVLRRYSTAARLLRGPDRPTSLGAALKEAGVASWPKALSQAEFALRNLGSHRCQELPKWLESLDRSLKAESSRGLRARLAIERFFCLMSTSAGKQLENK
ncbi:MAG: hypothetical protein CMJ66_05780 [Planctomycetaceae bacterium]|nr:hypothetical protein [Planctomycetaceae bacterium]